MPRLKQMSLPMPAAILALLLLSGCHLTRNQALSPKPEAGTVKVTVKVPEELVARDMQVIYRSTKCTTTYRSTLDWEKRTRDNYAGLELQPVRRPGTDVYEATVAVNGGGACRWRLSNVTLGVRYEDASKFGDDVKFGGGGDFIVTFDEANSAYGGPNARPSTSIDGFVSLKKDYYPWLSEHFIGTHRKWISLTTNAEQPIIIRVFDVHTVLFEPILHSKYLVRSFGTKEKQIGVGPTYYYPDGGSGSSRYLSRPDFERLQEIRMAGESSH